MQTFTVPRGEDNVIGAGLQVRDLRADDLYTARTVQTGRLARHSISVLSKHH